MNLYDLLKKYCKQFIKGTKAESVKEPLNLLCPLHLGTAQPLNNDLLNQ